MNARTAKLIRRWCAFHQALTPKRHFKNAYRRAKALWMSKPRGKPRHLARKDLQGAVVAMAAILRERRRGAKIITD